MNYKEEIARGRIPDFQPIFNILNKIAWFHLFPFGERQVVVNHASIQIYEPGESIFRQGEPSPNLYIIIYGSVHSSQRKPEWGPNVTMRLKTYFDGEFLGEISDYEAQKDQISTRMLKEL